MNIPLHFRQIGEGQPLILHHGIFGSSDNLMTVSRSLADRGYAVYALDARNHGQSPRSPLFNYPAMAADVEQFLVEHQLDQVTLVGHSMGGKVAMQYVATYARAARLVVVDIAPKFYPVHHDHIIQALLAVPLAEIQSRKEAEEILARHIAKADERQFILKNLYRREDGQFDWRINVPVLAQEIYQVGGDVLPPGTYSLPALFLAGSDSSYILKEDEKTIHQLFPQAQIQTIAGAGHWVHAQQPQAFVDAIDHFVQAT
ncbi:MAG: alpha/beta fold hydrolase [Spirosomataceae bacterium]